ncbi:MAG: PAS domain-containing protein [Phycisphaerales bacterium]|nr:PAS domain-containing protein [Phycisphaerales bacterium]
MPGGGGSARRGRCGVTAARDARVGGAVVVPGGAATAVSRDSFLLGLEDALRPLERAEEIVATAARLLGGHLGVDRCAYADIEADQDTMNLTGNYVGGPEIKSIIGRLRFFDFGSDVLRLMREDRPFVVEDVRTHRPSVGDLSAYEATQIRAVVCVPLHKQGRFVAAIAVHTVTPRRWSAEEVSLVRTVAGRCWESIERARALRKLRESEERVLLATQAAGVGIWSWDAVTGTPTWENDRPREIFGLPPGSAPINGERFVHDFLLADDVPGFRAWQERALAESLVQSPDGPTSRPFAGRIRRPDGSVRWIELTMRVQAWSGSSPARMVGTLTDVTEQREGREAARRASERMDRQRRLYEAILNNTPDLAYIFDLDHRFIYASEPLLRLWGVTWEQAAGKTCRELGYPEWHAAMHDREIDRVVETRTPLRGEVPFTGTQGERVYEYILVPVLGDNGSVEAVAGTTRDVTERKEAEAQREALLESERSARAEAERAGRVKDEFLATLSHELRTPLNAVLGWSAILRRTKPTPEALAQGLSVIDRNARAQSRLISDLLDMSRIVSGKMRLEVRRVDFRGVMEGAVEAVRLSAESKGVMLEIEPAGAPGPGPAVVVEGDAARLQQIVWNLVSNAVKFTPRGGRVQAELGVAGGRAELRVTDTGVGIRREFLPHVFERFRQADSSAARTHGGLGLGLSIVKQLTELHGGRAWVESAGEGRGATFTVSLPLAGAPAPGPEEVSAADAGTAEDLSGVSVLVVDDEPDARDLVCRLLGDCGATVVGAGSVEEALTAAGRDAPDVVVSDIGMAGRDGYELVGLLRARGCAAPAAAVTAYARPEDRARALGAGFSAHLAKPVEPGALVRLVASLARGAR